MQIKHLILGLILPLNIYSQNLRDFEPELIEFRYKEANVLSYENPSLKSKYYFDSIGFMKQYIIDGLWDSIKIVKNYSYDSLNNLLVINQENYSYDKLISSHLKKYVCLDYTKVLNEPYLDFINDSRFKVDEIKNDTFYIYKLACLETERKNQRGWYGYDRNMRNDTLLNKIVIINYENPNNYVVSYYKPDMDKLVYSEEYEFDSNDNLIRITEKHSTHTHDIQIFTKHGLIKSSLTNTTRRNENFIYSISKRKFKYNKQGLLLNQKAETQYLMQGHTTKTDYDFNYEYE